MNENDDATNKSKTYVGIFLKISISGRTVNISYLLIICPYALRHTTFLMFAIFFCLFLLDCSCNAKKINELKRIDRILFREIYSYTFILFCNEKQPGSQRNKFLIWNQDTLKWIPREEFSNRFVRFWTNRFIS